MNMHRGRRRGHTDILDSDGEENTSLQTEAPREGDGAISLEEETTRMALLLGSISKTGGGNRMNRHRGRRPLQKWQVLAAFHDACSTLL